MTELQTEKLAAVSAPLLAWYAQNARDLPWRRDASPYRVWVSEIMLQQTRVAAVVPYYERFMHALPTVSALAAVDDDTLMKLWEGLGYYSRARNLKRAAVQVCEDFGGEFPRTYGDVLSLCGIGEYTAGAICSIAYGLPTPAVDGNLLRVAARIAGLFEDVTDAAVRRRVRDAFCEVIDRDAPGAYNQALMDLGATVCIPNAAPHCGRCPLAHICTAHAEGKETLLPVRSAKKPRRAEERTVFLLVRDGKLALRKRPPRGLLASLWEFPNVPGNLDEDAARMALASWGLEAENMERLPAARHIFTHIEWDMHAFAARVTGDAEGLFWADAAALDACAVPSAFSAYTKEANFLLERK
ncbi:MAG: A/G-specific adenine glycosylase [Clostridia bacterium]|nr:A/G-specific adenine glycosylase [Clostridia bacterium]